MNRAGVEALLDELNGGRTWATWDAALSALLDLTIVLDEGLS